jgi:hypothetical protein
MEHAMNEQEQAPPEERLLRLDLMLEDWGIGVLGFTLEELEQVLAQPQRALVWPWPARDRSS